MRARTAQAQFWSIGSDTVAGRLVLNAPDADSFESGLKAALDARDLDLLKLAASAPITGDCSPELLESAIGASETHPLLFGRLCDAQRPRATTITEIPRGSLRPAGALWVLLDGVQWPNLPAELAASGDTCTCLYTSTDAGTLASAPWLVHLKPGCVMFDTIMQRPADTHAGILFESNQSIKALRRHLRRFTMIHLPDGAPAPVYFRFYDPRVALDMVNAVNAQTLAGIMAPMNALLVPISPQSLLPDHAGIAMPVTPFDSVGVFQDRLARIVLNNRSGLPEQRNFHIDGAEFSRFQKCQRKRPTDGWRAGCGLSSRAKPTPRIATSPVGRQRSPDGSG